MRGKAQIHLGLLVVLGITPAYAGKSTPSHTVKQDKKDHPRICGEKTDRLKLVRNAPGSPPHMRGKVLIRFTGRVGVGITPAYAGKSRQKPTAQPVRRDHPRICGEKYPSGGRPHCGGGSPPHMRGKGASGKQWADLWRITPAYAGKRLKRSRSTVPPVAIVPLFPSVCNKPVVSDGSPAGRDAPLFLPAENAVPASPAYNLRSL